MLTLIEILAVVFGIPEVPPLFAWYEVCMQIWLQSLVKIHCRNYLMYQPGCKGYCLWHDDHVILRLSIFQTEIPLMHILSRVNLDG